MKGASNRRRRPRKLPRGHEANGQDASEPLVSAWRAVHELEDTASMPLSCKHTPTSGLRAHTHEKGGKRRKGKEGKGGMFGDEIGIWVKTITSPLSQITSHAITPLRHHDITT
jgi:hypothetical protein